MVIRFRPHWSLVHWPWLRLALRDEIPMVPKLLGRRSNPSGEGRGIDRHALAAVESVYHENGTEGE